MGEPEEYEILKKKKMIFLKYNFYLKCLFDSETASYNVNVIFEPGPKRS